MAEIGVTEVDASRQALISSIVLETLKEQAQLIPTITDYSSLATPGNKSVAINRRTQFAPEDKTENTALSAQEMTFATDTIDLDPNAGGFHKAIYVALEDVAQLQASAPVRAEILKEMVAELALQVDRDIITKLKAVSTTAPDHLLDYADTVGDVVQLEDFAEARKLLKKQNLRFNDDRYWCVIPPDKEKEILGIDNFISAERYGSREALLQGEVGRVFGFRVMVHNELASTDSLFYHSSHVGYASQWNPSLETDRDLKKISTEFLLNMVYGVKEMDLGKRGVYFNGTGS